MASTRKQLYLYAMLRCISGTSEDGDELKSYVKPFLDKSLLGEYEPIINEAESLSAGIKDSNGRRATTWKDAHTRMRSLLESVSSEKPRQYYLPDTSLSISKSNFPRQSFDHDPDFKKLYDEFIKEIEPAKDKSLEAFAETLLNLLKRYAVYVPAGIDDQNDVSVYDHAKTTSALALCLYDWQQEGRPETSPFLLVGADFSGIQSYIYQIVSKYAAKNLKGRSFYIKLLSDAVVRFLLKKFDLPSANIVYNSGGSFYIVAPNTERTLKALSEASKEIEEKFFNSHKTSLYLAIDYVEMSKDDLYHIDDQHNLSAVWTKLFNKRDEKKSSKFSDYIEENYDKFFKPYLGKEPKFDSVTGEEILGDAIDGKDGCKSKLSQIQQELGKALRQTDLIVISENALPFWEENVVHVNPCNLGFIYYFVDDNDFNSHSNALDNAYVITLNGNEQGCNFVKLTTSGKNIAFGLDFYGGNQFNGKTFEDLCDFGHREFSRLGVLRMDVDNLGKIFQQGIQWRRATLSRFTTLSRQFDYFFSGYLNTIYEETDPEHSQIIYSGGDDLFIVGSWEVMIALSERIRNDFREYTCNNPAFSISGGISIVTAKFPIMRASSESKKEEKNAKNHCADKNSISIMGMALNWDKEYKSVKDLKDKIVSLIRSQQIDKAFISKMQLFKDEAKIQQIADKKNKISNYRVLWLISYSMTRMIARKSTSEAKQFIQQCIKEICSSGDTLNGQRIDTLYHPLELWAFACRWAELELRSDKII